MPVHLYITYAPARNKHTSSVLPLMCGIYYLWDGAAVIYIGASTNVQARIRKHMSTIDFCGYFCDECSPNELEQRETEAIREFTPPYNVVRMPV